MEIRDFATGVRDFANKIPLLAAARIDLEKEKLSFAWEPEVLLTANLP